MIELQPLDVQQQSDPPLQPGTSTVTDRFPGGASTSQVTLGNVPIVQTVTFANPETATITLTFSKPTGTTVTGVVFADALNSGSPTVNPVTGLVTQPLVVAATLSLNASPFFITVTGSDTATLSLASALPFTSASCLFPDPTATAAITAQDAATVTVQWTVTYDGTTPITCQLCANRSVDLVLCTTPNPNVPGRTDVIGTPLCP
ncbi:MAG TPA: hypothetical protein GXX28_09595 [Firmicutes bacterium]|nr:hypothetical protein [Bacillota bacterium]